MQMMQCSTEDPYLLSAQPVTLACCLSVLSSLLPNVSPCPEGLSTGRPHLCMQAFHPTGYDGCGPRQEDLQEVEAEQS